MPERAGFGTGHANYNLIKYEIVPDTDFNYDGLIDCTDVNSLVAEIVAETDSATFDLTADGIVDSDDLDEWRIQRGAANLPSGNPYLEGDANLDGEVDGLDFIIWNANKFMSSDGVTAVPEPTSYWSLFVMLLGFLSRMRRAAAPGTEHGLRFEGSHGACEPLEL